MMLRVAGKLRTRSTRNLVGSGKDCGNESMRNVLITVAIAAGLVAPVSRGQGLTDQMNFSRSDVDGLHLYGISTFFGYSVYDFPQSGSTASSLALPSRMNYGVSGTVGWQRSRGRTNFAARYSGGYSGDTRNSDLNAFNQSASLNVTRPLGRKWNIEVSLQGQELSLAQFVFEPSSLGNLAQSQASFDNLAAALSVGQFSNAQTGLLLNGGLSQNSATNIALLGARVLTYAAQAGVSYAHSSRLSFHFGSVTAGGQHRTGGAATGIQDNYVIPRTIGADASASMGYAFSPRTEVGLSVSQSYVKTRFQQANVTAPNASFGRKMGQHWFLRIYGGGSFTEGLQQTVGTAPQLGQAVWGGSIGFRTYANTLVATYGRSGYVMGASAIGRNTLTSAAWSWQHPRRSLGLHASYSRNETNNTGYATLSGWQATGGVSQTLKGNFNLTLNYTYLNSRGVFLGLTNDLTVEAVRISLGWAPQLRRSRTGGTVDPEEVK
jgi:hypothetical protein